MKLAIPFNKLFKVSLKKIFMFILFGNILLLLNSCKEDFNPKGEYKERYILNCVLRADTNFQIATVSKSYDVIGYNGSSNNIDPFIKDCNLKIWYKDTVIFFKDTSVIRSDTSRYKSSASFYCINNFKPAAGEKIEIEALLPNGKKLSSVLTLPKALTAISSDAGRIIPPEKSDRFIFAVESNEPNLIYAPRVSLIYFHLENGVKVRKTKLIPLNYVIKNGIEVPNYPQPTNKNWIEVEMSSVNKIMKEISRDDNDKGSYYIMAVLIDFIVYDKNLSSYYSSTNLQLDEFSIRLDNADFTNIIGGFGVFGGLQKQSFTILFDKEYIKSFGYLPEIDN